MFIIYWKGANFRKHQLIHNQDGTKVALIFGKSNKLIYFCISENKEIEL